MRGIEVTEAIANLWEKLPVGLGKDFNTVLKYVERLEDNRTERFNDFN